MPCPSSIRSISVSFLAGASVLAAMASPAAASFTSSQIQSPPDGTTLALDDDHDPALTVAGTTDAAEPEDQVAVRCFASADDGAPIDLGAADVQDDRSFSLTVDVSGLSRLPADCTLRAVPEAAGGDLTPFAGPRISVHGQRMLRRSGGTDAGIVTDFRTWFHGATSSATLGALGSCGVCSFGLHGDAPLFRGNGMLVGVLMGQTSAHAPDSVPEESSGRPPVTATFVRDPATGSLTVHDSEPLSRCLNGDRAHCQTVEPTGVTVDRTMVVADRLVTITDTFTGPVGTLVQPTYAEAFDGAAPSFAFAPGQPYARATTRDRSLWLRHVAFRIAGPGAGGAHGALTLSAPWAHASVTSPSRLDVGPPMSPIPASGALSVTHVLSVADTEADAVAAIDRLGGPSVGFSSPQDRSVVRAPSVRVRVIATDNWAVDSVTVNSQPPAPAPPVSGPSTIDRQEWQADVALHPGPNIVTAVAKDAVGNSATATMTIRYAPWPAGTPRLALVFRGTAPAQPLGRLGAIRVRAGCGALACSLTATGTVSVRGSTSVRLRSVEGKAAAGKPTWLRLKLGRNLSGRVQRALERRRKVAARITITARDAFGRTQARTVTVRARRAHGA